jgi:hypothetical protein
MAIARYGHTATALADGRMLVAGGVDGGASVEIYRPDNNSWKATASLTWPRYAHTVIAGGVSDDLFGAFTLDHTEVFDPAAPGPVGPGAWSDAGRLATPRAFHADVALAGGRVLAAGGLSDSGGAQRSVDTGEMHCPAATPPVVTRPPRLWIPFISRPPGFPHSRSAFSSHVSVTVPPASEICPGAYTRVKVPRIVFPSASTLLFRRWESHSLIHQ